MKALESGVEEDYRCILGETRCLSRPLPSFECDESQCAGSLRTNAIVRACALATRVRIPVGI